MDENSLLLKIQALIVLIHDLLFMFFDLVDVFIEKYYIFMIKNRRKDAIIIVGGLVAIFIAMCLENKLNIHQAHYFSYVFLLMLLVHGSLKVLYICSRSVSLSVIALTVLNLMASCIAYILINDIIKPYNLFWYTGIIIYSVFWILYSLISLSEVAKLANEIVAGIFTFIFTLMSFSITLLSEGIIAEYIIGLNNKQLRALTDQYLTYLLEKGLIGFLLKSLGYVLLIVGLSSLQVVISNIRIHWEKKYRDKELEIANKQ